jgi:hypothetical protein
MQYCRKGSGVEDLMMAEVSLMLSVGTSAKSLRSGMPIGYVRVDAKFFLRKGDDK